MAVAQVRTARHTYVAYLRPLCARWFEDKLTWSCREGYRLIDESLFDHAADAGEAINLAYEPAHASTRSSLLAIVLQQWNVTLCGRCSGSLSSPYRPCLRPAVSPLSPLYHRTTSG